MTLAYAKRGLRAPRQLDVDGRSAKPRMRLAAQHPGLVAFLFRLFLPAVNCRIESKRMNK
jgi:hypothetical protein